MTKNKIELYHYGVKGMKWGIRKGPEISKSEIRAWKKGGGNSYVKPYKSKRNKEIQSIIERMRNDPAYKSAFQNRLRRGEHRKLAATVALGLVLVDIGYNDSRVMNFTIGSIVKTSQGVKGRWAMRNMSNALAETINYTDGLKKVVRNGVTVYI